MPCDEENIDWVKKSLAESSPRIKVFDVAEADRADEEETTAAASSGGGVVVDWNIKGGACSLWARYTQTFTQTHSIVFLSDNLRNTLREVIRENGISPNKLMQDWETIERGIQTWLRSRPSEQHRRGVFQARVRRRRRPVGSFPSAIRDRASMTTCGWTRPIFAS